MNSRSQKMANTKRGDYQNLESVKLRTIYRKEMGVFYEQNKGFTT